MISHIDNSYQHGNIDEINEFHRIKASNYSSFHCIGGHNYYNGINRRKCVLYNVCHYEGEGDVIHYYIDPKLPKQPILADHNKFEYTFNYEFVHLGVYERFSKVWGPIIDEMSRPNYDYDEASRVLFYESFSEHNPGHFFDLLHSIYSIPIIHGYKPSTDIRLLSTENVIPSKKHREQLLIGLSRHLPRKLHEEGNKCYKTFFVGSILMSVLESSETAPFTAERMKNYLLSNLGYLDNKLVKQHKIVIIMKSHNIRISDESTEGMDNDFNHFNNHKELIEYLKLSFNNIIEIQDILPDHMTWEEQIAIIRNATVVITPPGGGSFLATFAREGCSIIISDKNFRGISVRDVSTVGQDDSWWTSMRNVNIFNYPVCSIEECPGDIIINLPRMYHVILLALLQSENHFITSQILPHYRLEVLIKEYPEYFVESLSYERLQQFYTQDICNIQVNDTPFPLLNQSIFLDVILQKELQGYYKTYWNEKEMNNEEVNYVNYSPRRSKYDKDN